ncbi:MAG: GTPase [Lachnospiraceae bacterium]|nr:GTPase [Lachnospiraceae bacterium]
MKPVYMINGFLESGKSSFIAYTLSQPYFKISGTTLLVLCEEGEVEYDDVLLKRSKTVLEVIEDEADFTPERLLELDKKYDPERIVIEYNGMWDYRNMKLPVVWAMEQQITMIDASTFISYFANMKSLLVEQLRKSELVIFNRCDGIEDLHNYKRNVKAIAQSAEMIFEDKNGEINVTMDEELPFDVHADHIDLDDNGYGAWYIDSLDNLQRYVGKTISFMAMVMKPRKFPKGFFVPGRQAMTCCANDIAFLGFACRYDKVNELKEGSWIKITAKVNREYFSEYRGEGPVLDAVSIVPAVKPEKEIIDFTS